MIKIISLLLILFQWNLFAEQHKAPKSILLQKDISSKIEIQVPKMDLNFFKWSCESADEFYNCNINGNHPQANVDIGNSHYQMEFNLLGSVNYLIENRDGRSPRWEELNKFRVIFRLTEQETRTAYTFTIQANGTVYVKSNNNIMSAIVTSYY